MDVKTPNPKPRPIPTYLLEPEVLSTKREKEIRLHQELPPKLIRSAPPVSRLLRQKRRKNGTTYLSPKIQNKLKLNSPKEGSIDTLNKNKSILSENFIVLSRIGNGSFGEVFKVRSKTTGELFAIKRTIDCFRGNFDRKLKMREVDKYNRIPSHPNCVKFFRAWEENRRFFIQTELCYASLDKYVSREQSIPEIELCYWLIDLLKALSHLHRHSLVHLDVKPENIFIELNGICKLGDYGIMHDLYSDKDTDFQEGDPKYLAPEVMNESFNTKADIFSLGMSMLELAGNLNLPRRGAAWHDLRTGKIPHHFLNNYSPEFQSIIVQMLCPNPVNRPSAEKMLSFQFFKKIALDRQIPLSRENSDFELDNSYEEPTDTLRSPSGK
ncbi:DgyrCDS9578 [Dimorphilus gyrociliatus]|uniref:non-specific serine/threonine protein kinase n=1 Tax=Dimorphilus gyrociliatus TaxID=2664684 RepID=A0A7I8VZL2_9ANNE|nr:DgyrCDS9578 [Dimorphilus gyrociliatus]